MDAEGVPPRVFTGRHRLFAREARPLWPREVGQEAYRGETHRFWTECAEKVLAPS